MLSIPWASDPDRPLPAPEHLFADPLDRPVVVYLHGVCSHRAEMHRSLLYTFLSAPHAAAVVPKPFTQAQSESESELRYDAETEYAETAAQRGPLQRCPAPFAFPPTGVPSTANHNISNAYQAAPPAVSAPTDSDKREAAQALAQSLAVLRAGFWALPARLSGVFAPHATAVPVEAPNAFVVSLDYRGFGDNTHSRRAWLQGRAQDYNARAHTARPDGDDGEDDDEGDSADATTNTAHMKSASAAAEEQDLCFSDYFNPPIAQPRSSPSQSDSCAFTATATKDRADLAPVGPERAPFTAAGFVPPPRRQRAGLAVPAPLSHARARALWGRSPMFDPRLLWPRSPAAGRSAGRNAGYAAESSAEGDRKSVV